MNYVYFKLNQILQKQLNNMSRLFPVFTKRQNTNVVINPIYDSDMEFSNSDIENNHSNIPPVITNKDKNDKPENKFYDWMEYIVCPIFLLRSQFCIVLCY
jgi:hypothetical protein